MKRTFIVLCLLLAGSVFAKDWHPFAGVSGLMEYPVEDAVAKPWRWNTSYSNAGTELQMGARIGKHEFYVAYRLSNSQEDHAGDYYNVRIDSVTYRSHSRSETEAHSEKRVFLGYRFWPLPINSKIAPMFGVALGAGRSKLRRHISGRDAEYTVSNNGWDYIYRSNFSWGESQDQNSRYCMGGLIDAGVAFELVKGTQFMVYSQIQAEYIEFRRMWWQPLAFDRNSHLQVTPSLALQLRYTFGG